MTHSRRDILVIDDYRPLAEAAATVAQMVTGRDVTLCLPGEAMAVLEADSFDLVILNRDMKPTAGPALCQAIRADMRHADATLVMMGSQMDGARARGLGADEGIATPFNTAAFRELLARLEAPEHAIVAAE